MSKYINTRKKGLADYEITHIIDLNWKNKAMASGFLEVLIKRNYTK